MEKWNQNSTPGHSSIRMAREPPVHSKNAASTPRNEWLIVVFCAAMNATNKIM